MSQDKFDPYEPTYQKIAAKLEEAKVWKQDELEWADRCMFLSSYIKELKQRVKDLEDYIALKII